MTWKKATLGALVDEGAAGFQTGPFGTVLAASEYVETGVPMVSVGEIRAGRVVVKDSTPRISEATLRRLPRYLLAAGDIVFARKGSVERSAWIADGESGWFLGSDAIRLRLTDQVDSRFVALQLQLKERQDFLVQHAGGSTLASMNEKILSRVPFVRPPLREQKAISEVLGALDDKIAANAKLVSISDKLTESMTLDSTDPSTRTLLSECALVTMGSSPRGEFLNEQGTGTVFYQGIRDFGMRTPTRRIWTSSVTRSARPGDTLLSVRAPVGRVNVAEEDVCIGRGLASIRSLSHTPWTLFNILKSYPEMWMPFDAEGTIFSSINRAALESLPVPTVLDGRAERLEAELTSIEASIAAAERESSSLASLRDALLPELMSGRLRVKDAERTVEEVL